MFEIGKRFNDQISEFQESAHLVLQLLQRLSLFALYGMVWVTAIAVAIRCMVAQMMVVMMVQMMWICSANHYGCRRRGNHCAACTPGCHQMRMVTDNAGAAAHWQALHGAICQFCDA